MEIIVGKQSGFCSGVFHTVKRANDVVSHKKKVYCLGELVHNERVIQDLEKKGMITVFSIDDIPDFSSVIFRAHGERKETYQRAREKNLEIIDLTCGKVLFIRKKIENYLPNSYIIILGKKNHPETIGTFSYAGEYSSIIETMEDISSVLSLVEKSPFHKIYIVSQTTFSASLFDEITTAIQSNFLDEVIIDKTICDATDKRQKETSVLSKKVNKMIIVGGKNSSNTKELFDISKNVCKDVFFVQNVSDLDFSKFSSMDKVGIMAGASTPDIVVSEIVKELQSIV